jgi:glutathione peroxidase
MSIYDYEFVDNSGAKAQMSEFKDKVTLIVNVASKCGLTSQYIGLQKLYENFKDKGFEILGFPCNQFAQQEPGSNEEIKDFCTGTFGVTFKLASKIDVNGENAHPLYSYLRNSAKGGEEIAWNFEKFLVLKDGSIKNFDPHTAPEDLEVLLREVLG